MHDFGLIKARTAKGAIAQYRIVKHDGAAGTVALATTSTDPYDGVSGVRGTNEEGEWIDIYKDGIRPVEFGGGRPAYRRCARKSDQGDCGIRRKYSLYWLGRSLRPIW